MQNKEHCQFKLQSNNLYNLNCPSFLEESKNRLINQKPIQRYTENNNFNRVNNQQTQKPRSISLNHEQAIQNNQNPSNAGYNYQIQQLYFNPKQEYQISNYDQSQQLYQRIQIDYARQNNNLRTHHIREKQHYYNDTQNQPQRLADQIDITIKQQNQQYKSLERKYKYNCDILKQQQLELSNHDGLPSINNKSNKQFTQVQLNRPSSQKQSITQDPFNSTNTSLLQTLRPICYYCKQDISEKQIGLVCWHKFHQECISEMISCQIETKPKQKLPQCLCGFDIKQHQILSLPKGQNFIKSLLLKQLNLIYFKYQNTFNKCPNCEFRFINNYRLEKQCYCPNCNIVFKIK